MKIAVVAGVVVPYDAISSAVVEQISALRSLPEVEAIHLFTQSLRRGEGCPADVIGDPWQLVRHPVFRTCDVAIFHWGIHYALFDAITLLGPTRLPAPVVHFHNCTPPSLVEDHHRDQIERSIHQLHHVLACGTPVWTHSEFNRQTLLEWGATGSQIRWVTFPIPLPPRRSRLREDGTVRLLSVGRLVPAKGVHVLLDALTLLPGPLLRRIRVRIASSTTFSSDGYREMLLDKVREGPSPLARCVDFLVSPSDRELAAIYQDTDVVVSTSFHEGLCVPVLEGYAAGCRAIGTTAGNLPYVVVPPDPVVSPGDAAALAAVIERVIDNLDVVDPAYHRRRAELVEAFSPRSAAEMMRPALASLATPGRVAERASV
jgi:glycosyltransferase involved in cell wall biosynthesis